MRIGLLASVGVTIDAFFPQIIATWRERGHDVFTAAGSAASDPNHTVLDALTRRPSVRGLRGPHQLRRWMKDHQLDVVVANTATASGVVRLARAKVPIVYFCHGLHWDDPRAPGAVPWRLVESVLLPRAAGVITINSDDEAWFASKRQVPLLWRSHAGVGLDTCRFARAINPGTPGVIVWAGELSARKRPELALQALSLLRSRGVDARLRMLGAGPLKEAVRTRATELGLSEVVVLEGHADTAEHFREAAVVLHTAKWEGLPRVLLEAVAVGRPVVAFDTKGVRDVPGIRLAPEGDVARLATLLQEELESPSVPVADSASLSADRVADGICAFLARVCGGESGCVAG